MKLRGIWEELGKRKILIKTYYMKFSIKKKRRRKKKKVTAHKLSSQRRE